MNEELKNDTLKIIDDLKAIESRTAAIQMSADLCPDDLNFDQASCLLGVAIEKFEKFAAAD